MAVNFLNNFKTKAGNFGSSLADALFGSTQTISTGGDKYPSGIQNYLDSLENQPYMQSLLNQPKETGLSLDQYKEGIAQGLNFGVPEIADAQKELKINIPKNNEEIELAKTGQFNSYPMQGGLMTSPRQGGFFDDFSRGYSENYNNGFKVDNLVPQNKNWATKIGEGFGSVGRFIDSPLGRGLLAAGLNSALGYDNSLQEGLTAFVGRQNAQTEDKIYRNQLKQAGFTDEDLSQIRGNLTGDIYKNLASNYYKNRKLTQDQAIKQMNLIRQAHASGQIDNNTANMAMANIIQNTDFGDFGDINFKDSNQTRNTDLNEQLLPYKQYALQVSPQVALDNLGLRRELAPYDIAYKKMQIQNMLNKNQGDKKIQENVNSLNAIKNQLDRFSSSFDKVDNPYRYRVAGGISSKLNTLTPDEANFNSQASLLLNKIARDLGGEKGVLSDQDIARIKESMPTLSDTRAQKQGKMNAIYDLLQDRMLQYGNSINVQAQVQQPTGNTEGWAF